MENTVPNISFDAINDEFNRTNPSLPTEEPKNNFNEKNYLDTHLEKGLKERRTQIRILPSSATSTSPFVHVHFHSIQLSKEQQAGMKSSSAYKAYVCINPENNPGLSENGECPFCARSKEIFKEAKKEGLTEEQRKAIKKDAARLLPNDVVIIRCIERGKEDEGVKFWKINIRYDGSDLYHKILNIYQQRREESMAALGQDKNIFDLYSGHDFVLTMKPGNKDGQTSIDIVDSSIDTPLSRDENQIREWVNDTKIWSDVFTVKPAEYLQLILDGKIPWFDKYEEHKWVDSEIIKQRIEARKNSAQNDIDAAEQALLGTTVAPPQFINPTQVAPQTVAPQVVNEATAPAPAFAPVTSESSDDLPF